MTLNVGVYLYPGVELLDFAGPCEVFTTANRLAPEGAPFSVFSVAAERRPATSRAGVVIQPDYSFADHPPIDVVLVPGGVVDEIMNEAAVVGWIVEVSAAARLTASVCNGAFLLAAAGVLDHRRGRHRRLAHPFPGADGGGRAALGGSGRRGHLRRLFRGP
jgi:transcriptional regulator GlxA family with amidase domain